MSLDRDPEAVAFERSVLRLVVIMKMRYYRRLKTRFRRVQPRYF